MATSLATEVMPDLRRLTSLAQQLNQESDALNQALQKLEQDLNAMKLGVEVWLDRPIRTSEWETYTSSNRLTAPLHRKRQIVEIGYGSAEHGSRRALLVRYGWELEMSPSYTTEYIRTDSLLRSSREIRLQSLPHLQDLIAKIESEVASAVQRIATTRKALDE
jgi:hypothetical protein